jgi:hypothetical protein
MTMRDELGRLWEPTSYLRLAVPPDNTTPPRLQQKWMTPISENGYINRWLIEWRDIPTEIVVEKVGQ